MRALAAAFAATLFLAAPATASGPTLNSLQRQVSALQRTVAALTAQQTQLQDRLTCNYAIGADNLNLVWHTVNILAQYLGFTPQPDFPRYDDRGACSRLGVTRR